MNYSHSCTNTRNTCLCTCTCTAAIAVRPSVGHHGCTCTCTCTCTCYMYMYMYHMLHPVLFQPYLWIFCMYLYLRLYPTCLSFPFSSLPSSPSLLPPPLYPSSLFPPPLPFSLLPSPLSSLPPSCRGRYTVKPYPSFLQLHGKTFDYKIPYDTVTRIFLLPHNDQKQMYFVVSGTSGEDISSTPSTSQTWCSLMARCIKTTILPLKPGAL